MFGAHLEVGVAKICTTPSREIGSEVKTFKGGRFGALLEVEPRKICTTPPRESNFEVKIVRKRRSRDVFGGSKVLFTWQAQGFRHVAKYVAGAKTLAGVVDLKRVRNYAFRVAGAGISCSVMSMFEASDVESVEKGCKFHVTDMLLCRDQFAWPLQEFVCLGSTFSWQVQYF